MRITIIAAGSRGDVQPFVALAQGLKKAGYKVTIRTEDGIGRAVQLPAMAVAGNLA